MVTITSFTEGKCVWCCQSGEGVHVAFQDGLNGFLCKRDFWSALKARSEPTKPATEQSLRQPQSIVLRDSQ